MFLKINKIMKKLVLLFCFPLIGFGQNCQQGEVDLGWGDCNNWVNTFHSDGCMPSGCYSIQNTSYIDLSTVSGNGQVLNGFISPNIGQLTNLTNLNLSSNQISGIIPTEIGDLTNLTFLSLGANQLTGSIPIEIGNLTNLTYLALDGNQIFGSIPNEITHLVNLGSLFLSDNNLTGTLPSNIDTLSNLQFFYAMNNQLSGLIPQSVCSLPALPLLNNNEFCPPYPLCLNAQLPVVIGNQDTTNCSSQCPGSASINLNGNNFTTNVSGGIPPYLYSWNTGATSQSINASVGMSGYCDVTDSNGCLYSASYSYNSSQFISVLGVNHDDTVQFADPFSLMFWFVNTGSASIFSDSITANIAIHPVNTSPMQILTFTQNIPQGIFAPGDSVILDALINGGPQLYQQAGDNLVVIWPSLVVPVSSDTSITPLYVIPPVTSVDEVDYPVYEESDNFIYDLMGRRYYNINNLLKGTMYIRGGKKYIKK